MVIRFNDYGRSPVFHAVDIFNNETLNGLAPEISSILDTGVLGTVAYTLGINCFGLNKGLMLLLVYVAREYICLRRCCIFEGTDSRF